MTHSTQRSRHYLVAALTVLALPLLAADGPAYTFTSIDVPGQWGTLDSCACDLRISLSEFEAVWKPRICSDRRREEGKKGFPKGKKPQVSFPLGAWQECCARRLAMRAEG